MEGKISHGSTAVFDSLYSAAWELLSQDPDALRDFLDLTPFYIAAHAGAEVVGFELPSDSIPSEQGAAEAGVPTIYLADDRAPTTRDLLKELDHPVFDFKFSR